MTQLVEVPAHAGPGRESRVGVRKPIWQTRHGSVGRAAEEVRILDEFYTACRCVCMLLGLPSADEYADRVVDGDVPPLVSLRRALAGFSAGDRKGPGECKRPPPPVHVGPPQGAQFSPASAGHGCEDDGCCQYRVLFLGVGDQRCTAFVEGAVPGDGSAPAARPVPRGCLPASPTSPRVEGRRKGWRDDAGPDAGESPRASRDR